ncbi:helicase-associated domain-containing protein [Actinoplanes sichuanensis]|uniref:Helicase-associated domain-containing protein n=1 Tax=Actinoplanes sichuanensis TaxID=512349 RepID=A0ABW4A942_9ACTN|nr:helicase-associated domain-containing protein [Actinoplanes sichuanensis]BEL09314.1 helicase-associated domain-containing protein [Actinoplanes sichuanensis]
MQPVDSLAAHLRTLGQDQLTALVAIRRDVTLDPPPKTAEEVAGRLLQPSSLAVACSLLTLPQLQVAEAAAALDQSCDTARIAVLLGVPKDDLDLGAALDRLTELALLWPEAGGLAAGHLSEIFPTPLDLGPGAAPLYGSLTLAELRRLAQLHGLPATNRGKVDLAAMLAHSLADPETVRRIAAPAPPGVRNRLTELARQPTSHLDHAGIRFGVPGPPVPWAIERGLVVPSMWGGSQMPREVALALRGDGSAPFDIVPPGLVLTPIATEIVEREATAAAAETLAAAVAVVDCLSSAPVPLLKTGGMGVREVRRVARTAGQDEDRTRLTLEMLTAGGLVEASEAGLTPSAVYDEYAAGDPADQLLGLVDDWLTMPAGPLAPPEGSVLPGRLLYWSEQEEFILVPLRGLFLRTVVEAVPAGQATTLDGLVERIAWQGPFISAEAEDQLERYVTGIWREAHRLGLLAHGAPSALCRTRLSAGADAARPQAEAMLPRALESVLLQNDLTAVVTGTPSAALLALLDGVATPESRSGAWTWRFSPGSVRAAFDAGHSAEGIRARLVEVAEGGRLPQTLDYLLDDVARRYGQVQVRPAGCCLCSEDETLLTEILHTRALKTLELVRLAPTVLVSAKPPAETLAALRAAGYAPVGLRADGSPAVEIRRRRRAAPAPDDFDDGFPALHDPAAIARALLGGGPAAS